MTEATGSARAMTDSSGVVEQESDYYPFGGERVEKQTGSTYNELVYDGYGNLVFIHDRTNWLQDIIPFAGGPMARYQNGNTYFLHGDALGSSVYVTEQPGWVLQKLLYYPWGQRWASAGVVDERFASLGQRDTETGNDPTLFRMYNPRLYRWLSPDPSADGRHISNPQSLNRYAYVLNNPTNFIDPLGLDPCDTHPNSPACTGELHFNDAVSSSMNCSMTGPRSTARWLNGR